MYFDVPIDNNMNNKDFHHSIKALKSGLNTQFLIETGPKKVAHNMIEGSNLFICRLFKKEFTQKVSWKGMWEYILVKNHSSAPTVATNVQPYIIWRHIKESTLVINHPAAPSMTSDADHQVV